MTSLFVAERRAPVYATLGAELDAIRTGTKAISFFASDRDAVTDGSDLVPILRPALARGLAVTAAPRGDAVDIFVHRAGDADRIAPLRALLARSPWTFEREDELGRLLGYTPRQRAAWLAAERHARPGYGVLTVYAILAKGVPPATGAIWRAAPGRVVSKAAFAKRRSAVELWRAGVDPRFARKLARGPAHVEHRAFAKLQRTPFERLTARGWT